MTIDIRMIRDRLPQQIADLESEARQEGYRHITRLIDEWSAGDVRFEGNGERLLGAYGACRRRGHDRRSGHVRGVADAAFLYQSRNARVRHRPDACPGTARPCAVVLLHRHRSCGKRWRGEILGVARISGQRAVRTHTSFRSAWVELHAPISLRRMAWRASSRSTSAISSADSPAPGLRRAADLITPRLASTYLREARPMPCCCS